MRQVAGTTRTTRLRKVACECGNVARQSRAAMSRGLLGCPCGAQLVPTDLDDVLAALDAGHVVAADLLEHAEYQQFERERASVAKGQANRSAKWGAVSADGTPWRSPDEVALDRVQIARALAAHEARHAALRANQFGGPPVEEPIPF